MSYVHSCPICAYVQQNKSYAIQPSDPYFHHTDQRISHLTLQNFQRQNHSLASYYQYYSSLNAYMIQFTKYYSLFLKRFTHLNQIDKKRKRTEEQLTPNKKQKIDTVPSMIFIPAKSIKKENLASYNKYVSSEYEVLPITDDEWLILKSKLSNELAKVELERDFINSLINALLIKKFKNVSKLPICEKLSEFFKNVGIKKCDKLKVRNAIFEIKRLSGLLEISNSIFADAAPEFEQPTDSELTSIENRLKEKGFSSSQKKPLKYYIQTAIAVGFGYNITTATSFESAISLETYIYFMKLLCSNDESKNLLVFTQVLKEFVENKYKENADNWYYSLI